MVNKYQDMRMMSPSYDNNKTTQQLFEGRSGKRNVNKDHSMLSESSHRGPYDVNAEHLNLDDLDDEIHQRWKEGK